MAFAAKLKTFPEPMWKERINSQKLSSDLHVHTVARMRTLAGMYTHKINRLIIIITIITTTKEGQS